MICVARPHPTADYFAVQPNTRTNEKTGRGQSLAVAGLVAFALFACGTHHEGGPPVAAPSSSTPSPDTPSPAPPFPWPASTAVHGDLDPSCAAPEGRLRDGLAVEQDVWMTVVCEVPRLDPAKVDAFVQSVNDFLARVPDQYRRFPVANLPPALAAKFTAEEKKGWGETTIVVGDAAAIAANPELRIARKLGSGAIRGVCAPWNRTKGHYEVTADVARNRLGVYDLSFSGPAVSLLADASQDPDLFDWDTMEAHGQTPSRDDGRPKVSEAEAQKAWAKFVGGYIELARKQCDAALDGAHVRVALYYTGYALHAVEDIAPHRGRTNPEHAYDAEIGQNPDIDPNAIALATDMATTFLHKMLDGPLKSCAAAFAKFDGAPIYYLEKVTTLKQKLQFTPHAIGAYRESAKVFAPLAKEAEASVRWFGGGGTAPAQCSVDP